MHPLRHLGRQQGVMLDVSVTSSSNEQEDPTVNSCSLECDCSEDQENCTHETMGCVVLTRQLKDRAMRLRSVTLVVDRHETVSKTQVDSIRRKMGNASSTMNFDSLIRYRHNSHS